MSDWFYAKSGQQAGPVSFEQLRDLARSGELHPESDLAWTAGMKDWQPSGRIDGLFISPSQDLAPSADPSNPYAAPQSTWTEPTMAKSGDLQEIEPGSEPLDVGACVKRGFEITKRKFGMILALGLVYLAVIFGVTGIMGAIDVALGWGVQANASQTDDIYKSMVAGTGSALNFIVSQLVSILMSLGVTRVGLNLVSGQEVSVGQLFGQGRKILPAIGASILYGAMILVGLICFIVPGIYLALRYGQFLNAMVDRNLGVLESLKYSSAITANSRMSLFALWFVSFGIVLLGLLALFVGLIFAYPLIWMTWMVAFRWLQYGSRATLDHPGTQQPILSSL